MIGLEHILQKKKAGPDCNCNIGRYLAYVSFTHPSFQSINLGPLFFEKNLKEKKKEREERHQESEVDKRENGEKGKKGKARLGCSQTINLLNCTFMCTQD